MIFYAVRHGQTDWNALGRVCGRTDLPLNAEGERLTTDGKFGASTVAAVKRYQTRHSLTSDGSVGKDTWEKMFPAA